MMGISNIKRVIGGSGCVFFTANDTHFWVTSYLGTTVIGICGPPGTPGDLRFPTDPTHLDSDAELTDESLTHIYRRYLIEKL